MAGLTLNILLDFANRLCKRICQKQEIKCDVEAIEPSTTTTERDKQAEPMEPKSCSTRGVGEASLEQGYMLNLTT